ncbi:hypothetical protein C789_1935 [Microcystis aeruginosa FACHB-905 = DIANCHI905]|nr:hypothetical protein C789_1935 [Microcystis aeruginosa FACHB-905 = DIANCHI905]
MRFDNVPFGWSGSSTERFLAGILFLRKSLSSRAKLIS